ncbi:DMT family transporter [Thalassobaculum litoreum]|uniref:EamA domain-containing membrane protein RarD n=1 Tax=Thalassobaculum litoreum DSM 18839 TaxID=1123362 RepID=A0A8G2BEC3_9PROT|nr:DMT family transporter [Thalassobaculum litoreum]SDF14103.1 EamA domain-containing membrane protein RarD [Thalassobaculum litoreum DSM 18839]
MVSPALPTSGSSAPAKAILMMIAAAGILTVNDAIAKWLAERYPVGQVLAMRGGLVVMMVYGWAIVSGRGSVLRVKSWPLHLTRGGLMAVSTFLFVTSLWLLPIADAIAISFAGPIFATALAALILGEPVGWRRWSAVAVGFAGVVVMVRPTPEMFRIVALIPIVAAFVGALRDIATRKLGTGGESTLMVLIVSTSIVAFAGLLTLPFGWVVPTLPELGLFLVTSVLVAVAQGLMIESLRLGEVGLVGPFKYTSLLWALVLGLVVWGDVPGTWTLAGAALVVVSGLYIWHRETVVRRHG